MTANPTFPDECVRHLAHRSCRCQTSGPDVDRNRHFKTCICGRAQEYLGRRVEWRDSRKWRDFS